MQLTQRAQRAPVSGKCQPSAPKLPVRSQALAQRNEDAAAVPAGRRDLLSLGLLLAGLAAAPQAAQAADSYEELKSITAARGGSSASTSLLESFAATKGSTTGGKVDRGIRAKLGAQAANAPKGASKGASSSSKPFSFAASSSSSSSSSSSGGGFKFNLGSSSGPKPKAAAPKPAAAPRPAPKAAAASGGAALDFAPLLQAGGVLGAVGIGANLVSSVVTSKPKYKEPSAAAASRAATPTPTPAAKAAAAAAAGAGSRKISSVPASRAATPAPASRAATPAPAAGTGVKKVQQAAGTGVKKVQQAAGGTGVKKVATVVKKVPAGTAVAASGTSIKAVVKKALVNEEAPDEPSDFATGGFLGAVALLAGFLLFGLPKGAVVEAPRPSAADDPLVQEARTAGVSAAKGGAAYVTPFFKGADEASVGDASAASRRAIIQAPKLAEPAPTPKAVAPAAPALSLPKPAAVPEAPKPAAVPAFKLQERTAPAAAPAAPAAAAKKAAAPAAPASEEAASPSAAQNLLVVAGGIAVVVTAFALTGSGSSEESSSSSGSTDAPAAVAGSSGEPSAATSAAAETVSATATAASAVAAAAAPAEGAQAGNEAYDKAVLALMADPDVTDDLMSVLSAGDAPLKNIPALAFSLISTPANAEKLDGFAFQKLPKQRYERVRALMLDMGLQLPDTPRAQTGAAATLSPAGDVGTSDVDPEKLRGVFEALLKNEASRSLMRQLLKGAGMPFNEEAFEEQVKLTRRIP